MKEIKTTELDFPDANMNPLVAFILLVIGLYFAHYYIFSHDIFGIENGNANWQGIVDNMKTVFFIFVVHGSIFIYSELSSSARFSNNKSVAA